MLRLASGNVSKFGEHLLILKKKKTNRKRPVLSAVRWP